MVVRDAKRAAILFFDLYASFFASGEGCCRTGRTGRTFRTGGVWDNEKKREDFGIEIFSWWVKCGFRTHDLRNHNPTL